MLFRSRFDRIEDFTRKIAIVPCSGLTGEGIPELLMILAGLSQHFLKGRLEVSEKGRGTVLEVREMKGFGTTIDVILYDGKIRKGDFIVIGGKEPIVTKVKALLLPRPLKEIRTEKRFESVEMVSAAAGVKIAAPGLEKVIAGSPVAFVSDEKELEKTKEEVQTEVSEVEFDKDVEGIVVKADTLGSLEAMVKILRERKIPVKKAEVGSVNKEDVIEASNVVDETRRAILAFNSKVLEDAERLSRDLKVKIFVNNIIYRLVEDYEKWVFEWKEEKIREILEKVTRPCEVKVLKGYVFRQSNPAIFGVEVLRGILRPGVQMRRKDGKIVGSVKEMQREGVTIQEAKKGERVAVSMEEPTIGRQIKEGDVLFSVIKDRDLEVLRKVWDRLGDDEKELIKEISG